MKNVMVILVLSCNSIEVKPHLYDSYKTSIHIWIYIMINMHGIGAYA